MKYNETYLDEFLELGRIEQNARCGEPLTPEEQTILDAAIAANPREVMEAAKAYEKHLEQEKRLYGGTIITERRGWRDGKQFSERTVETFPPLVNTNGGNGANGRTAPRQRGAGRPRAKAGSRSSGSSSGDDSDEPEPPSRRLCAFCGRNIPGERSPLARYCSDRHAARDRQRRKRTRDRSAKVSIPTWRDEQRMLRFEPGERDLLRDFYLWCRCTRFGGNHILTAPDDTPTRCVKSGRRVREVLA
jgi:hypothetical protein